MKKWIVADADHLAGRPRVRDTRISVAQLLEYLAVGMTIPQIVDALPESHGRVRARCPQRAG